MRTVHLQSGSIFKSHSLSNGSYYWQAGLYANNNLVASSTWVSFSIDNENGSTNYWGAVPSGTVDILNGNKLPPLSFVQGVISKIKQLFPINLPVQFYNSWNKSSPYLPSDLSFISSFLDSSGNIFVSFGSWLTPNPLLIWGSGVFTGTSMGDFFNFLKKLSRYGMYGLFVMYVYRSV